MSTSAKRKKTYLLTMQSGETVRVETELSMLELSNELRSRPKLYLKRTDQQPVEIMSQDVRSMEHAYRSAG